MDDLSALTSEALNMAASSNWKKAVDINLQILKLDKDNLKAMNRLAKAYMELDKPQLAKKIYKQVLAIDQYNTIAKKNLKRLQYFSAHMPSPGKSSHAISFIDEPGVTKSVQLINVGEAKVLAQIDAGERVNLLIKKRHICVTIVKSGLYLGKLPDDLSLRLITLINGGNEYQAWIKSIDEPKVILFIKELFRSPKFNSIPSFPDDDHTTYLAFTDPKAIYEDRPDTCTTDEVS